MAVAYRPVLDTSREIVLAVLPWLVLLGLVAAWSGRSIAPRLAGMGIAVAAWSSLIFNDDRWSLLTFGLYGLSFIVDSTRPRIGVTLAGVVTAVWTLASLGGPTWTVVIPVLVFGAASTIAFALHRIGRLTARQAALISELQVTRDELATSERSRGHSKSALGWPVRSTTHSPKALRPLFSWRESVERRSRIETPSSPSRLPPKRISTPLAGLSNQLNQASFERCHCQML